MQSRFVLFGIFIVNVVASRWCMSEVELALFMRGVAVVPDVAAPMGKPELFAAVFSSFTPETRIDYLRALWTLDVVFPISVAGALSMLARHPTVRWLPFVAAVLDVGVENVLATVILLAGSDATVLTAYAVVNAAKFAAMAIGTLAVAGSLAFHRGPMQLAA